MASWYEDLVQSLDLQPADVATMFAGARATVPAYMGLYAGDTNAGHDEELLRRRGPLPRPALPQPSASEQQQRMIEEFERQFPTPELRAAAIKHMRAVRAGKAYDPGTATRRVDFLPEARHEMRAAPAKPKYAGGGKVKKTVQQMADELLVKGTKLADKPDLARRSLFGLKAQPLMEMPIAKLDDKALARMEKQYAKEGAAPTITEKTTTVSPDAGATKSTLKSITETPVSRRTVLKSAAGQAMQGVLPQSMVPTPSVAGLVGSAAQTVAKAAAPTAAAMPITLQGLIARAAKMGLDEDDTIKMLENMGVANEYDVMYMLPSMRNPYDFYEDLGEESMSAARAMSNLINHDINSPAMSLRGPLREIRRENPGMYDELKQTARDISQYGYE
jgi:hypothetical protein